MNVEQLQQKIDELEMMYHWLHQGYRLLETRLAEALDDNIRLKTKLGQVAELSEHDKEHLSK